MPRQLAEREKQTIKDMGGKPTINSGATFQDGDGRIKFNTSLGYYGFRGMLLEVKSTDKKQFTLKKDILEKAELQARANKDLPAVVVDFGKKRYIILDEADFTDILEYFMNERKPNG